MDQTDAIADLVRTGDRERWLAVQWAPADRRPALLAIAALDLELARIVAAAREPMVAQIRLAWWGEQVAGLDPAGQASAPILAALQPVAGLGVNMAALARLVEGFHPLLEDAPRDWQWMAGVRGGAMVTAMAAVLAADVPGALLAEAGTAWALARFWREGHQAVAPPCPRVKGLPPTLAILFALARDDLARARAGRPLAPAASAPRQWRMWQAGIIA